MKTKAPIRIFILVIGSIFFFTVSSCIQKDEPVITVIGISKGAPLEYYGNYSKWLKSADTSIVCIDLYHMPLDSALEKLNRCSGLLISGGPDVYPGRYGQADDTVRCGPIDYFRDSLEWALIEKAKQMELPIMGICRGLQIFNVYHGGSLYPDLPTDLGTSITHRCPETYDCLHDIIVEDGSGLFKTAGTRSGTVNSYHHQGINKLGEGLSPAAYTGDGLIEAIEYANKEDMPFFMGVQWHPEKLDPQTPYALPIAMYFVQEAKLYSVKMKAYR